MDKSIIARAQELVAHSNAQMTLEQAIAESIFERFDGDGKRIAYYMAGQVKNWTKAIRKASYDVPEHPTLFDVPQVIIVTSPDGDVAWPIDIAPAKVVGQWWTEGEQYHGGQHRRFRLGKERHFSLPMDPDKGYKEQVNAISETVEENDK